MIRSTVKLKLWAATLYLILGGSVPAHAYFFWSYDPETELYRRLAPTAEAIRWDQSSFPLRFRMLENDNLPADVDITQETWTAIVRRSLDHWNGVTTAEISLILEEATVPASQASAGDGINTIGFSSDEQFQDSWVTAGARWRHQTNTMMGCDIEVSPYFVKNWAPQDVERLLEVVVVHEMGHCLGLGHTEPHPMPLWTDLPVNADPSFLPDPVMSYSNSYGLDLPEDDTVGVSLLYPAPGFLESRGAIRGSVVLEGRAGAYAYLQAVRPGSPGVPVAPGPGTFAGPSGEFHLEGLSPGNWMLWIHPILVTRRNAYGRMLELAAEADTLEFRDRLRWVRVDAGETLEGVEITVYPGRETAS